MTAKENAPAMTRAQSNTSAADSSTPRAYCFVDDIVVCGENGGMSACHLDEETFIRAMLQWRNDKRAEYAAKFAYCDFKRRLLRGGQ